MKVIKALAILLGLTTAAQGQSYSVMQWGMDKSVSPYGFGANINGSWYNLGTVSSNGIWNIPITVLSVNSAYNSEITISVTSAPSYTFPEALATEFQGDFSKTNMPLLYTITGAATLGQPTTGYQWNPAVTPYQTLTNNFSGWNNSTSGNAGRTGYATFRTMIQQQGQGDTMAYYAWCAVQNTRSGATHWLANPACAFGGGDLGASVDGAYLEGLGDLNFSDNGHDITAAADVRNFIRTNNTAALGQIWLGYRTQSTGSKNIDVGLSLSGNTTVGLDTTQMTNVSAAVNAGPDQRIILNSYASPINGINWYGNNFGGSWLAHTSSAAEVQIGYNNSAAAAFKSTVGSTGYFSLQAFSGVAGLIAEGNATDVYSLYSSKGNAGHIFRTGNSSGPISFQMDPVANSTNYLKVIPATTGNSPQFQAVSTTDTNVNIKLTPLGAGQVITSSPITSGVTGTTAGGLTLYNATSGSITISPTTGALGTVTATLPANTGTLAELNFPQTWSANQSFGATNLLVNGTSTGATTIGTANTSATNYTVTIPANTGTLAELNLAQTWSANQSFGASNLLINGTSTGATTIGTANTSATSYTATLPANTGTLAELNLAQTWSANQSFGATNLLVNGTSTGATTIGTANTSATSYTATLPANTGTLAELNLAQSWTAAQTFSGNVNIVNLAISATAPTATSVGGCGTTPSVASNGTAAFQITIGTTPTAAACVVTMPAATTGWACSVSDITTQSTSVFLQKQIASTTTSISVANYSTAGTLTAFTAADKLVLNCHAY